MEDGNGVYEILFHSLPVSDADFEFAVSIKQASTGCDPQPYFVRSRSILSEYASMPVLTSLCAYSVFSTLLRNLKRVIPRESTFGELAFSYIDL